MIIKILGQGCKACKKLSKNIEKYLKKANLQGEIIHITDYEEILKYGILNTPGLVVNDKLISSGRLLSLKEIEELISSVL